MGSYFCNAQDDAPTIVEPEIKKPKTAFHPITRDKYIAVSYETLPDSIFIMFDPIDNQYIYNTKALPGIINYGANFRYLKAAKKLVKTIEEKNELISKAKENMYPMVISHDWESAEIQYKSDMVYQILNILPNKNCTLPNCSHN